MSIRLGRRNPEAEFFVFETIPHNIMALKNVPVHNKAKNVQLIEKANGNRNREVEMVMPVLDEMKCSGLVV